jgi:hypothetical protein
MGWTEYTDIDRLVLSRWTEVLELIEVHRQVQEKIEERIEGVGERLTRWVQGFGFELDVDAKNGQYSAHRPAWADRRRGAKVQLVLGGFCPMGYRRLEWRNPYLWVCTEIMENFKIREADRIRFAEELRKTLGERANEWNHDEVEDDSWPLGQYLREYDEKARCGLMENPDKLYDFAVVQFPKLFELADPIDACLKMFDKAETK